MSIATTGEMPVNYGECVSIDLCRTAQAGLSGLLALRLDQGVIRVMLGLRGHDFGEELLVADDWEQADWYPEPAFTPIQSSRGIVGRAVVFDVIGDEIDWD